MDLEAGSFKTGELVQLRSGGAAMTVHEEVSPGRFRCAWFNGKKLERELFEAAMLESCTSADPPFSAGAVPKSLAASGFPFQTAIADLIHRVPGFQLVAEEFPWLDRQGEDRFLDLVGSNGVVRVAVECKKSERENYTFLCPSRNAPPRLTTDVLCLRAVQIPDASKRVEIEIENWSANPESYESTYCVIGGSDRPDQRLLERDAYLVVSGAKAFALHEKRRHDVQTTVAASQLYIPVIVTTAVLSVAGYDPEEVSLETGKLGSSPAFHETVPFVRFRKCFSAPESDTSERTVFVVTATSFGRFLEELRPLARLESFGRIIESAGRVRWN